jgi:hypothetical protein
VWWRGSSSGRFCGGDDSSVFASGQRKKWGKGKTVPASDPFIDGAMRQLCGDDAEVRLVGGHRVLRWQQVVGMWHAV